MDIFDKKIFNAYYLYHNFTRLHMENTPQKLSQWWENNLSQKQHGEKIHKILWLDPKENIIKMEWDIHFLQSRIEERIEYLNKLSVGIKQVSPEQDILNKFLDILEIERTEESRYIAYDRISKLREDSLLSHIRKLGSSDAKTISTLSKAFSFVQEFHDWLHEKLIETIQTEQLLTPFYRKLISWFHSVWKEFHTFHKTWNEQLIYGVNKRLANRFGSKENVLSYLSENYLFDIWHGWKKADRSYSILQENGDGYKKISYRDAFPQEIKGIIEKLEELKESLQPEEDEIYEQKEEYLVYFDRLISAFWEQNTDHLIIRWAQVDESWMAIRTPFQIVHPLEHYEDIYRWAVAPEWDFRLENKEILTSAIQENMRVLFEEICIEKNIAPDDTVKISSLQGLEKVQLYISNPLTYYGTRLNWLPSAQVVPNDKEVTKTHGKKIFAFPKKALANYQSQPPMKLSKMTLSDKIRTKRKNILLNQDSRFYKLYDIETIGHEFWHTLWMDSDTEILMNQSWNFKNIEEWKATTGGLMAFFQNPKEALKEDLIVNLITRSVGLINWMKNTEVVPYYTEWLIHLKILFDSGIIFLDDENKVEMEYTDANYEKLRELYSEHYGNIIDTYTSKADASEFLSRYTLSENGYFLPKDEKLRTFVKYYYELYEKLWNIIDEEV